MMKKTNKFIEAFSPTILETKVPSRFIKIINDTGDDILSDDRKSAMLFKVMRQACLDYLKYIISKNRAYGWNKLAGSNNIPTLANIHLTHSWIVSQYAGEYNPYHHHTGDFSAVVYLKLPPKMQEEFDVEFTDHYPTNGLIEFMYGESSDMRSDTIKFKPEVGTMLVFPSYLKHFVYPFYSEGERRSMSFNAHMKI
jgi:hypothetical protein